MTICSALNLTSINRVGLHVINARYSRPFIRSDAGCVEPLARISDAELTGDQVGELDVDPAEHAITIGMQWLCRNAADIALIHVERGENAQLGPERRARERIVEPTMPNINLAVAIALINDGAILGDGRPIVIEFDACAEGCNQAIELLPVADVSRYQRIGRWFHCRGG